MKFAVAYIAEKATFKQSGNCTAKKLLGESPRHLKIGDNDAVLIGFLLRQISGHTTLTIRWCR
jgi:hypothetical protein